MDQSVANYSTKQKVQTKRRWIRRFVSNIYDFCIHNAYILHKVQCSESDRLKHTKFFEAVVANEILEISEPPNEPNRQDLCQTSKGNCYHESHDLSVHRGRSQICCCYCEKRCCPTHRYWICLACFFVIKPFLLLHSALRALLPRRNN